MAKNYKNKKRGFTLIETFVAITILMIAVLGPLSLLSSALKNASYVQNEIIATYLAQEGLELVLDLRNNGPLSYDGASGYLNGVLISFTTQKVTDYTGNICLNSISGYYTVADANLCNSGDKSTIFKRTVTIHQTVYDGSPSDGQFWISSYVDIGSPARRVQTSNRIFINPPTS